MTNLPLPNLGAAQPYDIPPEGSLGLLALGAEGVRAWRHKRDELPGAHRFEQPQSFRPKKSIRHQATPRLAQKVLLIGWDSADWKVINPLIEQGHMPTLARLIASGMSGNIATLDPPLSPMLWTSVATGQTADKHGILGFVQPNPETQTLSPVLGSSRRRKAIWNILHQAGLRSHIIGWWPSHPAEPLDGVVVTNFYQKATAALGAPWPLSPGAIHPPAHAETLAGLRVHPHELTAAHILPFVPDGAQIDQESDHRLNGLTQTLAHCASIQAAATWAMANEPWEFMAVYFDGLDHFSHQFMRFHPPRQAHIDEAHFSMYHNVVTAAYRLHDMMLYRLVKLAGPDTTIVLLSDHGFHPDHLRPARIPRQPAGPTVEHRHYGIVCLHGESIHPGQQLYGTTLLDIAPTVLQLFGLPVGQDMDGKPVIEAFVEPAPPAYLPTWEDVPGDSGMVEASTRQDPWAEQAMMEQLVRLGYIEPGNELFSQQVRESDFYLARVYLSSGRKRDALPLLEKLCADYPSVRRYAIRLAQCYLDFGRIADCRGIVEAVSAITEGESPSLDMLRANLLIAEEQPQAALEVLQELKQQAPTQWQLYGHIGRAYRKLEAWGQAINAFRKALQINPENATVQTELAYVYLQSQRYEDAVDAALNAVALSYHQPLAHFYLGEGLRLLKDYQGATDAYLVCVSQVPGMAPAHSRLADLYETFWWQPETAQEHRARARALTQQADNAT